ESVSIWNSRTGERRVDLEDSESPVAGLGDPFNSAAAVAYAPDGRTLAVALEFRPPDLWDTRAWKRRVALPGEDGQRRAVRYSSDGRWLADLETWALEWRINLYDLETRQVVLRIPRSNGQSRAFAFSPDGATLVVATTGHAIELWDCRSRSLKRTLS